MTTGINEAPLIGQVLETWQRFGVFDFILPFLLVFSIVYGILERTQLFGDKVGKSVNAIIAFTIAMTTTLTSWFIGFLTGFLPWVSTISIVIITGLMLIAIFAKDFEGLLSGERGKTVLAVGAVIVIVSLSAVLLWLGQPIFKLLDITEVLNAIGITMSDLIGIVFFIAFVITILVIGKEPGEKKSGGS